MSSYTLAELANRVRARLHGDPDCVISRVETLRNAAPGAISFLANPCYRKYLAGTAASAVILAPELLEDCPAAALVSDNPYLAYARVAALFRRSPQPGRGVHPAARLAADVRLGEGVSIGPNCVLEEGVSVGSRSVIGPGCILGAGSQLGPDSHLAAGVTVCYGVVIGSRAHIHPGAVLGSDGFGLAKNGEAWESVPQLGGLRIGNDVEIGANTTIARGALDDTVIDDGVKLDSQVHIGHNVHIGAHTVLAGCVGVSGSAEIGRHCLIGGGVGIVGHLEIADDVIITGMSMVTRTIRAAGVYSSGVPAQGGKDWNRNLARLRRLESLIRRVEALENNRKG